MIWLLLIFKTILTTWLFLKTFRFLGTFLAVHTAVDVCNKFYSSYYTGMISFIIVPHILIACVSEIRKLKYLRYTNIASLIALMTAVFKYNYPLMEVMNYFLLYSITILISAKTIKQKEDSLLSLALISQIIEIIAYKAFSANYVIVNWVNSLYYTFVTLYLIHVTFNAPILDDNSNSLKNEVIKVNTVPMPEENDQSKAA